MTYFSWFMCVVRFTWRYGWKNQSAPLRFAKIELKGMTLAEKPLQPFALYVPTKFIALTTHPSFSLPFVLVLISGSPCRPRFKMRNGILRIVRAHDCPREPINVSSKIIIINYYKILSFTLPRKRYLTSII